MGRNGVALLASWDYPSARKVGGAAGAEELPFSLPHPIQAPEKPQSNIHLLRWPDLGLWAWGTGQG